MSSLAHTVAAVDIRRSVPEAHTQSKLLIGLLPAEDGWSLVGPDGEVLFHAPGIRGRRRCLQFARAHGVLALHS